MPKSTTDLAVARYDLLVVGGGIHGLFAAYDAAARGLAVALVDRADFGSGLSFNHQRTIHGGLRAIERGQFAKAHQQVVERRTWARIAPHLSRPLPFLVGTYRFTKRSRWLIKAGFAAYDLIGRSRNTDVSPELHLPKARLESASTARRLFAGIEDRGLSGGAVWYDYQVRHPDRLNWTVALAALQAGARLSNYSQVVAPLKDGRRIAGARVRDLLTGREHDLQAAVTLLAAGSGLGPLVEAFGTDGAPPLLRAMNLLIDRPAKDIALVAAGRSGRMLTAVPWRSRVLVGTHQSTDAVAAHETCPPPEAIDAFLADLNAAFPRLEAARRDVRIVHHGLTPAVLKNGQAALMPDSRVICHARRGVPGLISLVGVKFTTARLAAEQAVDAVCRELALSGARARCRTAATVLPFAGISDAEGRLVETLRALRTTLDRDVVDHLTSWYGAEASDVVLHAATAGQLGRLTPGGPVLEGEITYAAERSHAVRLGDVVLRRTVMGSAGHPGAEALTRAADLLGQAHGWSDERRTEEIRLVEAAYAQ
jgi:glycerol-3-phosphate dehydrogenase